MNCPQCSEPLHGLGTRCWAGGEGCGWSAGKSEPRPKAKAKPRTDTRNESEIRLAIRAVLELHGFVVIDFEQGYRRDGSTRVRRGVADLYAMAGGHSAWIEVKTAKGVQSEHQQAFERDCHAAGIPYLLWRHEDEAIAWAQAMVKEQAA